MKRQEIGGIPVFYSGEGDQATAAVTFRSGIADESAPLRGINHVVEHLALSTLGRRDHAVNGFVNLLNTVFYAQGTGAEVLAFLGDLTEAIAAPDLERIGAELRVLRTEASLDAGDFTSRQLFYRFGASGFGGAHLREFALGWVGRDEIQQWRDERLTAGNVAIWLHGTEPPEQLGGLPEGGRRRPPAVETLPRLELPSFLAAGTGGVALTLIAERSVATVAALEIVLERLHERLRLGRGLSYAVSGGYQVLSASNAHASVMADCLDEHAGEVTDAMLEVIDELVEHRPTTKELEDHVGRAERAERDNPDDRERAALDRAVTDALVGAEVADAAELTRQRRELQPQQLADALRTALPSALVIAPAGTRKPRQWLADYEPHNAEQLGESIFKARGRRASTKLGVGARGLSHTTGDREPISICWTECALAIRKPVGSLLLLSQDGTEIEVNPRHWRDGDELLDAIERHVPEELLIPGEMDAAADVERLAETHIKRRFIVDDELKALPEVLLPGEAVRMLGRASLGMKAGLIALTDRRLLYLFKGLRKEQLVEIELEEVSSVRARGGVTEGKLYLEHGGHRTKFSSVVPRQRAHELADAIEGRAMAAGDQDMPSRNSPSA